MSCTAMPTASWCFSLFMAILHSYQEKHFVWTVAHQAQLASKGRCAEMWSEWRASVDTPNSGYGEIWHPLMTYTYTHTLTQTIPVFRSNSSRLSTLTTLAFSFPFFCFPLDKNGSFCVLQDHKGTRYHPNSQSKTSNNVSLIVAKLMNTLLKQPVGTDFC